MPKIWVEPLKVLSAYPHSAQPHVVVFFLAEWLFGGNALLPGNKQKAQKLWIKFFFKVQSMLTMVKVKIHYFSKAFYMSHLGIETKYVMFFHCLIQRNIISNYSFAHCTQMSKSSQTEGKIFFLFKFLLKRLKRFFFSFKNFLKRNGWTESKLAATNVVFERHLSKTRTNHAFDF